MSFKRALLLTWVVLASTFFVPATAQTPSSLPGCTYNSTPPSLANRQTVGVQCSSDGRVKVEATVSGGASTTITQPISDLQATGTVTAVNDAVTVSSQGTGVVSVVVSANTNVTLIPECLVISTWATCPAYAQNSSAAGVTSITTTGTWAIYHDGSTSVRLRVSAIGATPTATVGLEANAGSSMGALLRKMDDGGCTPFTPFITAASNNATLIKASAGTLCALSFAITSTASGSIRFYNTATTPSGGAPCNSATNVALAFPIQSNATSPGASLNLGPFGQYFSTGIVVCVTGVHALNDNTNAPTTITVTGSYK